MIAKHLKHASFFYFEDSNTFKIILTDNKFNHNTPSEGATWLDLDKIYSFAFSRFVLRVAQKGLKRVKN